MGTSAEEVIFCLAELSMLELGIRSRHSSGMGWQGVSVVQEAIGTGTAARLEVGVSLVSPEQIVHLFLEVELS